MKILFDNNEKTLAEYCIYEEYGHIPTPVYITQVNNGRPAPPPVILKKYKYRLQFTAPRFGHTGRPVYLLCGLDSGIVCKPGDMYEYFDKLGYTYRRKVGGHAERISWEEYFTTVVHTLRFLKMGYEVSLFDELRWSRDAARYRARYETPPF